MFTGFLHNFFQLLLEYLSEFVLNSLGNEKLELFSQGTNNFQNFENKTLSIADYKNVKKSIFDWLAAKLWHKQSTILWNVCTFE